MSHRFPPCTGPQVVKVLRRHDFALSGQSGSHQKWRRADGRQVIVALHGHKPIPLGTLKRFVEGNGLGVDAFR